MFRSPTPREARAENGNSEGQPKLALDPTDEQIMSLLRKTPGRRLLTRSIAKSLGRDPRSIGKNLSKLVKLRLIDKKTRKGYCVQPSGELTTENSS